MDKPTSTYLTLPSPAEVDRLLAEANAARGAYIANSFKRVFQRLRSLRERDETLGYEPKLR